MKLRHYVFASFAALAGLCVTAYAHLPQDSYYEYRDANGSYVGWRYQSCFGKTTGGGVKTTSYTVEHTPCGDEPGTGTPVDGSGGAGIPESCGDTGEPGC